MRTKVTSEGLLIPKTMLPGVDEVEIRTEQQTIMITPVRAVLDPIFALGTSPVDDDISDGSVAHDRYLYGRR